jgi:hypothetical protein
MLINVNEKGKEVRVICHLFIFEGNAGPGRGRKEQWEKIRNQIQPTTGKGPSQLEALSSGAWFLACKHKSTGQSQIHQTPEIQVGCYMLSGVDRQTPGGSGTPSRLHRT